MCVGDSMTAFGSPFSYPEYLEKYLNEKNIGISFSVINKGVPGIDSEKILYDLKNNITKYNPHMIITMLGINDNRRELVSFKEQQNKFNLNFYKKFKLYKLFKLLFHHISHFIQNDETEFINKNKQNNVRKMSLIESGFYFLESGDYEKAEKIFRMTLKIPEYKGDSFYGLGRCYRLQGLDKIGYDMFLNALNEKISIDIKYKVYVEIGRTFYDKNDYKRASKYIKKAIDIKDDHEWAYLELARCLLKMNEYDDLENIYLIALNKNPNNHWTYIKLAQLYIFKNQIKKAEDILIKGIKIDPQNDMLYGAIKLLISSDSSSKIVQEYIDIYDKTTKNTFSMQTYVNYKKINYIVKQKGIKLVCVQYPMRGINILKNIFEFDDEIIFIDNESIFKNAVKDGNYNEYFSDMFAGDFGHCTDKGIKLFAKNIADNIYNKCFK